MSTPSEKLVPIWIRDYVQEQIQQAFLKHDSLADPVPPCSEPALRGECRRCGHVHEATNHCGTTIFRLTENEADAYIVGKQLVCGCADSQQAGGPPTPDPAAQPDLTTTEPYLDPYYGTPPSEIVDPPMRQQAGGPPTEDLAAQLDSNPEIRAFDEAYQSINRFERSKTQRIGVYDYDSLVACLRTNWEKVADDPGAIRDTQDMIQWLTAEIQTLRRDLERLRSQA